MATRARAGVSRRGVLGFGLLPLLLSGRPLQAMMPEETTFAVARLLQAALPAHGRHRRPMPDLVFSGIETALARKFDRRALGGHLLARLGITAASCRARPIVALRERLQLAVRDDFRRGLMMEIDGWYLSETEGIVYALSRERFARKHAPDETS